MKFKWLKQFVEFVRNFPQINICSCSCRMTENFCSMFPSRRYFPEQNSPKKRFKFKNPKHHLVLKTRPNLRDWRAVVSYTKFIFTPHGSLAFTISQFDLCRLLLCFTRAPLAETYAVVVLEKDPFLKLVEYLQLLYPGLLYLIEPLIVYCIHGNGF